MKEETTGFVEIISHYPCMCFLFSRNHPYELQRQISSAAFEEYGLVSVICEWEGLVSAGLRWEGLVSGSFGSFRLVSASVGWFWEVTLFSNYQCQ